MKWLFLLAVVGVAGVGRAQQLESLVERQPFTAHRVSSADPAGGNWDMRKIEAGKTLTIAELDGPGQVTHIWFTYAYPSRSALKKLVIRAYFDDIEQPCVEAPLGDFFGLGHAQTYAYAAQPIAVGTHSGLNCYWPMPFASKAKLTVTNEGQQECRALYFQVDYRKLEKPSADGLHFFARYRQEFGPVKGKTYEILDTDGGGGHYAGCNLSIEQTDGGWWGEGDMRIYVDGNDKPSIAGTGSEDDFGGAWCYSHEFAYPYFGTPLRGRFNANNVLERYSLPRDEEQPQWRWPLAWKAGDIWNVYRYHVPDPVPFTKSIRVDIEHGAENNERADWMSSVAYWYQAGAPSRAQPLPATAERMPGFLRPRARADGRWEAENFIDAVKPTGGTLEEAGLDFWRDVASGRYALAWESTAAGESLELPVKVEKAGRYKVAVRFMGIEPGGRFKVQLDDQPAGEVIDLYRKPPVPEPVDVKVGEAELEAGAHAIRFIADDPAPSAKGRRCLIDYVSVEPLDATTKPAN